MAFTIDEIAKVLTKTGGNISKAATALKVTRQAVQQRVKDNEQLQQIVRDAREQLVDMAEDEAKNQIRQGNTAIIIYTLKTQGKDRGWQENSEVKHSGEVSIVNKKAYVNVSPGEWAEDNPDSAV